MSAFAVLVTLVAWWGALRWRGHTGLVWLQLGVFTTLGSLFVVVGGFDYWWDTSGYAYPERASKTVPVCGGLILLAEFVLMALRDSDPHR